MDELSKLTPYAPLVTGIAAAAVGSRRPLPPRKSLALAALGVSCSAASYALGHDVLARHLGAASLGFAAGALLGDRLSPWPVTPGAAIVLWGDLEKRLRELGPVIERARPAVVIVHGSDGLDAQFAGALRGTAGSAAIWVEQWVDGPGDALAACDRAERAASILGAVASVWNVEAPLKNTGADGRRALQSMLERWARTGMPQGFTSYAQPGSHAGLPWAALAGGRDSYGSYDLGCSFSLPQVYPFGDERGRAVREVAPYGALTARMTRFRESWSAAVEEGLISPSCQTAPMIPGAWIEEQDEFVALGMAGGYLPRPPMAVWWPWHGLVDQVATEVMARF